MKADRYHRAQARRVDRAARDRRTRATDHAARAVDIRSCWPPVPTGDRYHPGTGISTHPTPLSARYDPADEWIAPDLGFDRAGSDPTYDDLTTAWRELILGRRAELGRLDAAQDAAEDQPYPERRVTR